MARKKVFSIGKALSKGLEETIHSANSYSSDLRMDIIPIDLIELDSDNPRDLILTKQDAVNGINSLDPEVFRKRSEMESLQSLANSIKTQGILNPITVYKEGEIYKLIAGERRTLASLLAEKHDIQAKIIDYKPDKLKIRLLQWIENIERSDLKLSEKIFNLEKIAEAQNASSITNKRITSHQLKELLGCSESHADRYLALLNAQEEVKEQIRLDKIRSIDKAVLIIAEDNLEKRKLLLEACLAGSSLKQLRTMFNSKTFHKPLTKIASGRPPAAILLGTTKNTRVGKFIISSIIKEFPDLSIKNEVKQINWEDYKSINEIIKNIVAKLEKHFKDQ